MADGTASRAPASRWTAALFSLAALSAFVAVRFAVKQSVWTDEATQLSGESLGVGDQLRWLAGRLPQAFSVPLDRTPPLSYWLGSLWAYLFGNGVLTARYLSVCFAVASIFAVWAAARLYLERRTALICAALLALSPNFFVEAAEIRSYAAFIFLSTLLIYCYLKLLIARSHPSRLDLWEFALAAILCSYTHYFGMVISAGAVLCLLQFYLSGDARHEATRILVKAKWPLLFCVLCAALLGPLIFSAVRVSAGNAISTAAAAGTITLGNRIHDLAKLAYRFFGHQSMLGVPGLSAAALLAGLTLFGISLTPGSSQRARQLLLFFFVNLGLVTIIGLTQHTFLAFAPNYNVWALPVIALLAATALTHRNHYARVMSVICVSTLLVADCYAALRLSTVGEVYAHTRTSVLKQAVDSANPKDVIVLYINDDALAPYFAMGYAYKGALPQYFASGNKVHLIGDSPAAAKESICDLEAGTLIIAGDAQLSAEALQFHIVHPDAPTEAIIALAQFLQSHQRQIGSRWQLISRNEYLAQSTLALAVLKRRAEPGASSSRDCYGP